LKEVFGNKGIKIWGTHYDLIWDETRDVIKKFCNEVKTSKYDAAMIVIMTHGGDGGELEAKDRIFNFKNELVDVVAAKLPNKRKIFVVNACRGSLKDSGQVDYDATVKYTDILVAFSTYESMPSARSETGTWFIQAFCEAIEESDLKEVDFFEIMRKTNKKVAEKVGSDFEGELFKQTSGTYSTMSSSFRIECEELPINSDRNTIVVNCSDSEPKISAP